MTTEEEIHAAQVRLKDAALAQPMSPQGASISAYLNTILVSCRIDALIDLWLHPPNASWTKEEALDAAMLKALTSRAEALESAAAAARSAIQVASSLPQRSN